MTARALALLCVVLPMLSACSGPSALLKDRGAAPAGSLRLSDQRPPAEVKFNSKCVSVPGREIGEAAFDPPRLLALQARLEQALARLPTSASIHRFQVCVESNGHSAASLAAVSYAAAVVAEGAQREGVDLASVDLDVEIDGIRYRSQKALNCHIGYVTTYSVESESVQSAIWRSLDAAVADIAAQASARAAG